MGVGVGVEQPADGGNRIQESSLPSRREEGRAGCPGRAWRRTREDRGKKGARGLQGAATTQVPLSRSFPSTGPLCTRHRRGFPTLPRGPSGESGGSWPGSRLCPQAAYAGAPGPWSTAFSRTPGTPFGFYEPGNPALPGPSGLESRPRTRSSPQPASSTAETAWMWHRDFKATEACFPALCEGCWTGRQVPQIRDRGRGGGGPQGSPRVHRGPHTWVSAWGSGSSSNPQSELPSAETHHLPALTQQHRALCEAPRTRSRCAGCPFRTHGLDSGKHQALNQPDSPKNGLLSGPKGTATSRRKQGAQPGGPGRSAHSTCGVCQGLSRTRGIQASALTPSVAVP